MDPLVRDYLEAIFRAAVTAVDPGRLVSAVLEVDTGGAIFRRGMGAEPVRVAWDAVRNVYLVGGGKAGRAMGEAALATLGGRVSAGVIAGPRGEGGGAGAVRFVEAGHPLPDAGSRDAAREMMALLQNAAQDDLVIALVSGGGSAMISAPAEGIPPGDKESTLRLILRSGADIAEFNAVRKHLSLVKGGRMAMAAAPARVWGLLLSDVPGDDPAVIASGPFSPDPTTCRDALDVLSRRKILAEVPSTVRSLLEAGAAGRVPETPKPGDPVFDAVACAVVGSNRTALEAAAEAAQEDPSATVLVLPGFLRGEARECARSFVEELRRAGCRESPPRAIVLIAGGETTVTVRGKGKGGRNQEFALAAAIALDGEERMAVLSCGTDGIDGPTDAAGAVAFGDTCARARAKGLSPRARLDDNDAYPFFADLGDLIRTGPTGTNVADLAVGVVAPRRP
ncbi:MAG: DUF4147 domain-containing protein [Deltaproteobacteria bacterium]|nr:DUF4147 domain-containing protein [Deltaproteobacteria bacterium]